MTLLKALLGVVSSRFLNILFGMTLFAMMARTTGPDIFGIFAFQFSICAFLVLVVKMGLEQVTMSIASTAMGDPAQMASLRKVMTRILAIGILATAVTIMAVRFVPSLQSYTGNPIVLILLLVYVLASGIQHIEGEFLRMFRRFFLAGLSKGAANYAIATPIYLTAHFGFDHSFDPILLIWSSLAVAAVFSTVAIFFINKFTYVQHISKNLAAPSADEGKTEAINFKTIFPLGTAFLISYGLIFLANQSDVWMAAYFFEEQDVGLYSAGARLAIYSTIFMSLINSAFLPDFTKSYASPDEGALTYQLRYASSLGLCFGVPTFVTLFILAEFVCTIIYGVEFKESATYLRILLFGYTIAIFACSSGYGLLIMKKSRELLLCSVFGVSTTLLSTVLFSLNGLELKEIAISYAFGTAAFQFALIFWLKRFGYDCFPSIQILKDKFISIRRGVD